MTARWNYGLVFLWVMGFLMPVVTLALDKIIRALGGHALLLSYTVVMVPYLLVCSVAIVLSHNSPGAKILLVVGTALALGAEVVLIAALYFAFTGFSGIQ